MADIRQNSSNDEHLPRSELDADKHIQFVVSVSGMRFEAEILAQKEVRRPR